MTYSGASTAAEARMSLSEALGALQQHADIPQDVMAVTENIARSVGALFDAEKASSEVDGKACIKSALGGLSQTLALLQDVSSPHPGIDLATETIAKCMGQLYPLTTAPTKPPINTATAGGASVPKSAGIPAEAAQFSRGGLNEAVPTTIDAPQDMPAPSETSPGVLSVPAPAPDAGPREEIEANIGATTESNFFVGFSGEVSEGGVFCATYEVLAPGTRVNMLVTLPGGFEFKINGWVRFVRDPMDFNSEAEPGMGVQFENLPKDKRELVLRFIRKRPPMFFDD